MFDGDQLSTAGALRLQESSRQVRNLPFDIWIQVGRPDDYAKAIQVYNYLFQVCDISPLRLGLALSASKDADGKLVLTFRHPSR